ncbi:PAS domain-containing protein [Bradyrhizobium sp.]|uniref:PAS domain-containing protein n=1 Tax=Bradyrhizobium sp. TaxID=376 RepID=UPI002D6697B3|nr:PAS domain-containing protein [Bradyrhizobium sp.]HZR71972.1 PAS domain-containing protein [Bradyrhizobium sp.]
MSNHFPDADLSFLTGGGKMAELILRHDWKKSPLGPPRTWSPTLRAAVGLILPAQAQIVLFWGPDFIALYNDAYAPTIGSKHPRALGRPARENWSELWGDLEPLLRGVLETGQTFSARDRPFYIERHGVGETVYFDVSYSAVREGDGKVAGVLCVVSETTVRVHAQQQITSERERLAQLFRQAPGFMALLEGPDHVFGFVNPAYQQLIGHRDVVGHPLREALPEVTSQGFFDLLNRVYSTGEPYEGKAIAVTLQRVPGAEPESRILDFVYQPIKNIAGSVTGIFVEGTDVTDAVRAEVELRASEVQFRSFAQAIPNHFWTSPPDGQLDWFNDQVYAYSGMQPGELDRGGWVAMVHPEDLPEAEQRWQSALSSGEIYEAEFRLKRHDGAWRWHLARAVPIRDTEGRIIRWVGTNTDIQDQKEVSAALTDINAALESRVNERTRQLREAEEKLRQAHKMEAVGQLTGGLAHDFNNLLQGISGSLDRIQSRITKGKWNDIDRFVKAAMDAANRAAALTHRLLAFSRQQTLDPRPANINHLIAGLDDLIRQTMGPTIEVTVTCADDLWPTKIDIPQLENALLNLCINARDAMPDGGKLAIETANRLLNDAAARERDVPPGEYVSVSVTDTGTGMTPDVIARAFDPFFTTKPLGQGTGLGLSMTYGFVRQSGGQVRIDSEIAHGTAVRIYLPRYFGALENEPLPHGGPMDRGSGETVLVVDDDPTVRMLVTEVLAENAYNILEATDGPSAARFIESDRRIDLLITDVGLPGGMNGRQIADAARLRRPDLKVLFITGYAENTAIKDGDLDPGMAILAKPFAMSALGSKIRAMLKA